MTLASYNRFQNNILKDTLIVTIGKASHYIIIVTVRQGQLKQLLSTETVLLWYKEF